MEDLRKLRAGNSSNSSIHGYGKSASYNPRPHTMNNGTFYNHHGPGSDNSIAALTNSFANSNLAAASNYSGSTKGGTSSGYPIHPSSTNVTPGHPDFAMSQPYMFNPQVMWTSSAPGPHAVNAFSGYYNTSATPYIGHNGYGWQQYIENSPHGAQAWATSRLPSGSTDVPSLLTPRRDSGSSNEHEGPGTPYSFSTAYGPPSITVMGHSPESALTWTPSPSQPGYAHAKNAVKAPPMPHEISVLLKQEPIIPKAVPAPYSPTKPLDRALENPHGQTNVYIRGLQPGTTDEMLVLYAQRFGTIASSKAIIDHGTGLCKGFGFVKYHNYKDAERCIRGFHYMGYESSFARESFYAQLKKLHDESTTNLYVSNLPKSMNEHELAAVFEPFKVCSSRILRHADGTGRGVGFARFENRDICEQVIKQFNNAAVGDDDEHGEKSLIQIRYADTPEQKALKQQTTAARNYRTAEYESQTRMGSDSARPQPLDTDFESYLANTTNVAQLQQGVGSNTRRLLNFPGNDMPLNGSEHNLMGISNSAKGQAQITVSDSKNGILVDTETSPAKNNFQSHE